MFAAGDMATAGVEQVAETGGTSSIVSELMAAKNKKTVRNYMVGSECVCVPVCMRVCLLVRVRACVLVQPMFPCRRLSRNKATEATPLAYTTIVA